MASWRLPRPRGLLPLVLDVLLVVLLSALDMRDLHYKLNWIGPYDSFSFTALSSRTFDTKPVLSTANFTSREVDFGASDALFNATSRDSGWPSLLSRCDAFYSAGASLFIGGMGVNCSVYSNPSTTSNSHVVVPLLYMSASLRADSMAWAACRLLYRHRKPVVCHDHIVTGFLSRYGFEDAVVPRTSKLLPFSDGEREALALLRVIAKSEPLTRATCVEGFAYTGPALYKTTIFGCGAPNAMDSAFIGVHATTFQHLHQDKAWLTVDTLNVMGFKYLMRQNVKSEFTATRNAATGAVELTPKTITNFSSSGALYTLMIVLDVLLLVINLLSALEIAQLMVLPQLYAYWTGSAKDTVTSMAGQGQGSIISSSLYRSRVVVVLLSISQLLSWIIVLPNSVIFTWSTGSKYAKLQAYLSSLRLWVLILLLLNALWDAVVSLHERLAYSITKHTFITSYEILGVGALVSYELRTDIFAVGNTKYALELQRTRDTTSFAKRLTLQNAYNEALDFQLNTPPQIVWIMYKPLVQIILWSLFFCVVLLVVRFVYYRAVRPWVRTKLFRRSPYAVSSNKILAGTNSTNAEAAVATETERERETETDSQYERLPLEKQLNDPIRARCLVRRSIAIETICEGTHNRPQRCIRATYFLEAGVLVDQFGDIRARSGFFKFLEPRVAFGNGCGPLVTTETAVKHLQREPSE